MPSILAGDLVDFLEDAHGAEGHILEIADGRSHQIEAAAERGGRIIEKWLGVHEQESNMRERTVAASMI